MTWVSLLMVNKDKSIDDDDDDVNLFTMMGHINLHRPPIYLMFHMKYGSFKNLFRGSEVLLKQWWGQLGDVLRKANF